MDIYRCKVYINSTTDFNSATYLQDVYISGKITDPNNYGALVDSNMNLTNLGLEYQSKGLFDICSPFYYNGLYDHSILFTRGLSFFRYYLNCAIDLQSLPADTTMYCFITTDNSEYYERDTVKRITDNTEILKTETGMFKKSDGSAVGRNISIDTVKVTTIGSHTPTIVYFLACINPNVTLNNGVSFRINTYSGNIITSSLSDVVSRGLDLLLENDNPWISGNDPYTPIGNSDTGGGGGTFDGSSDPVSVPSLPSVGATDTGFISLFVPSQAQLQQVASYLWSNFFDLDTFKKIFEDPMDCILGLSVVPVSVPTSGNAQITVGNIELSGITLPLASQQYIEIDCGTLDFTDKYFGSYLDQEPYTKMALFVPYSGIHSVSADDIMGRTVGLKYHIDILTGSLVAFLTCGNSVLYEFNGACASNIPVNSLNYASTIENAIRIAVNIGTTVATAGAAAPLTGGIEAAGAAATFGKALNMAGSTAEGALSLKPSIDRAGSLGGTTGLMGNQKPYFIITRPRLCKPANQNTFFGYPSFITTTVSDLIGQGYTAFDTIILAGLYLTDSEKNELKQILESGVYL